MWATLLFPLRHLVGVKFNDKNFIFSNYKNQGKLKLYAQKNRQMHSLIMGDNYADLCY